jgi:hypothetical protein
MYANKTVGKSKVFPVMDKQELSEDNIQIAAVKHVAGVVNPLDSDSDREEAMVPMDTKKTKAAQKKAIKFVHQKKDHEGPETAPSMDMYLRVKQMSLFPSIY